MTDVDGPEPFDRQTIDLFRANLTALEWAGLRERSWRMREFLARAVSAGRAGFAGLLAWCAAPSLAPIVRPDDTIAGDGLVRLARLVANQALCAEDDAAALTLYDQAAAVFPHSFRDVDATRYILLLGTTGQVAQARAILDSPLGAMLSPLERALLRCNLRCWPPNLSPEQRRDAGHRLLPINRMFAHAGLCEIGFTAGATCFERLAAPSPVPVRTGGPLVSVVMTAYNPPMSIRRAVDSVLRQSWRNLQLVIVDDHSDAPHASAIAACAALDPRVSVTRLPVNGGTYAARNIGIALSAGTLITFHDADDWSHPQKIEKQVNCLMAGDHLACTSDWTRATTDLEFRLFSGSGRLSYENLSSFMIRRDPAMAMLGGFDEVRNGADTEARHRLEAVSNRPVARVEGPPLSIGLLHASSLTSESITPGWFSPQRIRYRAGWRRWHQEVHRGAADPRLPQEPRPFAVPVALRPDRATAPAEPTPDRVLLGDFRYDTPATRAAIDQARRWSADGHAVGFCQVGVMQQGRIQREWLSDAAQDLVSAGIVARLGLADVGRVSLLLVADAATFDLPPFVRSGLEADALVVRADAWSLGAVPDRAVALRRRAAHLEQAFARPVRWLACGGVTRADLAALVGAAAVLDPEEIGRLGLRPAGDEGG